MKQYICIQKCPELDAEKTEHCIATKELIKERQQNFGEYCYSGNTAIFNELKED